MVSNVNLAYRIAEKDEETIEKLAIANNLSRKIAIKNS
jgi:hypothetical protein